MGLLDLRADGSTEGVLESILEWVRGFSSDRTALGGGWWLWLLLDSHSGSCWTVTVIFCEPELHQITVDGLGASSFANTDIAFDLSDLRAEVTMQAWSQQAVGIWENAG